MNRLILLLLVVIIGCSEPAAPEISTFILLRHAEKQITDDRNPDLTESGLMRAQKLVEVLGEVKISAIYSSDFKRTVQTVDPIASQRNIPINKYDPRDLSGLKDKLLSEHQGQTVIVSGHSNTTPQLINELLGENEFESLNESEYDWVYIVDVIDVGNIKVKKLKITL